MRDGALTGRTAEPNLLEENRFLIWKGGEVKCLVSLQRRKVIMPNKRQLAFQSTAVVMAFGLLSRSLLPDFTPTLCAQTVDPKVVLGDTTMPSPDDVSQTFPYGITGKTPPSLIQINFEGHKPYHKHRINLRLFQGSAL